MSAEQEMRDMGYTVDELDAPITNTGSAFEFYQHCVGKYGAKVGKLHFFYKNDDGKSCERNDPGAVRQDFAHLDLIVVASPDKHGFQKTDEGYATPKGGQYGELFFRQYITLKPDEQWRNKALLETFAFPGKEIIEVPANPKNKADFKVHLNRLPHYYGAPVAFEMKMGKKREYINGAIQLTDQSIDDAKYASRVKMMSKFYQMMHVLKEQEEKERQSEREESKAADNTPAPDVADPESLMNDSGVSASVDDYE